MAQPASKNKTSATDVTRRMVCGGLAGIVAKTATNPLDRIRMLAQTGEHGACVKTTSSLQLYRSILEHEGVRGLWAGNGANLLRVFPSKAIVFSSNDVFKQQLRKMAQVPADEPLSAGLSFLAGGMSGMTACSLTYPLDFARGRISGKLGSAKNKQYRGVLHTLTLTVRDEGVRGLYKGITPTLLGTMPYEGIKFGTVGILEIFFPLSAEEPPSPLRKMCFGGMGGVTAGCLTYPNDTVRRLLQLQGSRGTSTQYKGYWDCVKQVYRQHGITRFYNGLSLNIVRMAPNTAVQFGSYELLKQWTADWF